MIPQGFKPMLAADLDGDTSKLDYPVYASVKLDGVRCIVFGGVAYSRSLKPIPNRFIQAWAAAHAEGLEGQDGELIVGPAVETEGLPSVMSRTMSGVMSPDGEPDFTFHVFDRANCPQGYADRNDSLWGVDVPRYARVFQLYCSSEAAVLEVEAHAVALGYEGIMVRKHDAPYKYGRATLKSGWLSKLKRFVTDEAAIIGTYELMRNGNEATTDALGHTERSTAAAGLVPGGTLGGLLCRRHDGVVFGLGGGFTAKQRDALWAIRDTLPGMLATYKHFPYGAKDAPRFPVFVSLRNELDL